MPLNTVSKKYFLVVILLLSRFAYAQTESTTVTVDSLNRKANELIREDVASAFVLLTDAENLAAKLNYKRGLAMAYQEEAEVFRQHGYTKKALELYYRSIQLSRQTNDEYSIAKANQHISTIQRHNHNYIIAWRLLNASLKTFVSLNKAADIADIQLRIGLLQADLKNYQAAVRCYNEALRLSMQVKYLYGEKKSYYNRALLYEDLAKPDSVVYYLNKTLHIDTLTKDTYGKTLAYIELSKTYASTKQWDKSLYYAQQAYTNANSVNAAALSQDALKLLVGANKFFNNSAAVIKWQDELVRIDNLIATREKKETINFLDVLHNEELQQLRMQRKVTAIQSQLQKRTLFIAAYTCVLLVVIVIILNLNYSYKKAKTYSRELNIKNVQINQQMALLDQLNTEVIQQNQKLEDDNELKSKLLSIISHDLRKPLSNTQSLMQLIKMELLSAEEMEATLAQLEAQYARALNLLDNMLFWIKGQLTGISAETVPVNVSHLALSVIEEQRISVCEKKIQVRNHIGSELTWHIENEVIKIVCRNLLTNAIKFTPVGGCIDLYAQVNDTKTSLTIKDNGIGISAEMLAKINSKIYHTSKGTLNEAGTGFGLMLIRDLIKKYNGELLIDSLPGKGSAFTISFPAKQVIMDMQSLES
ncbi:HAMP domain-containing histidine kinase [Mucilaginibacter robiniae]|uniref:histidine kinase n=1 Tax=Mucilaginibacter robiniae TaxID=2728022 RepID=A0A7L5DXZ9_9SPHI|nr:HAMP domain-containing sensor histidine kinase [Mucilaginibacter robiniae]QJD95078.1 HAMP domain-containing histidine kinase [Mucilaginibacter robiniae]